MIEQEQQPMSIEDKTALTKRLTVLIEKANNSLNHAQIFTGYKDAVPQLPQDALAPITEAINFYEAELNAI